MAGRLFTTITAKTFFDCMISLPTRISCHSITNSSIAQGKRPFFLGNIYDRLQYYSETIDQHIARNENVLMFVSNHHTIGQFYFDKLSEVCFGKVIRYGVSVTPKKRMEAYFRARNEGGAHYSGKQKLPFPVCFGMGLIIVERPKRMSTEMKRASSSMLLILPCGGQRSSRSLLFWEISPPLEVYKRAQMKSYASSKRLIPQKNHASRLFPKKGYRL